MQDSFFFARSSASGLQRPPTAAQRSAALRHKVHKLRPIATVPADTTDRSWAETKRYVEEHHETMRPSFILSNLKAELQVIGDDPTRRVAAHRKAFEAMVGASDGCAQEVLQLIFTEYERSAVKGAADTYNLLLAKKEDAERANRSLQSDVRAMERRMAEMSLHIQNVERKLKSRTEQLTELSAQHNIPLRFSDDAAPDSKTRTLGAIRSHQEWMRGKIAGRDGKEALSKERIDAIDKEVAADCAAAEAMLAVDLSELTGIAVDTKKAKDVGDADAPDAGDAGVGPAAESECTSVKVPPVDGLQSTRDAASEIEGAAAIHARAEHPLYGGGHVCADLEADADDPAELM